MYCLRYWARYVRKEEVKSGGIKVGNESASWAVVSWRRQVREGLHRLQGVANQGLESP